ncbi:branched-chain amino acid ABC transporter permease [Haloarcula hispanica]|jgi:branched-chain amino acid transport system permease protein|uniref:Branched-chain amino acid ABC transporter permease n=2 Tax=Haloarcula TaxID=2237 RepID=Q5V0V0_HALMA|nr:MULTISPECIES: branched-chain amino acid ABC transporter permease [Haloarcula]AAV46853.1 branched-chain amino acid ABC transporter permease protein [Haloarcula marismortui ATCC 43049]KZX47387.1 branched-chain amino acid ABC transporter permease [Haloarcula sp. K1]MCJ0619802.1 branched-chain amino acid ABC transporter permease [Haloarcula hispanica]QCP91561.1 branched-chain amino acid ABC transporter permease [Haloarcula marismortui ATCC 43049]RYJ10254.1 branched-chain amino acid ABC transpor
MLGDIASVIVDGALISAVYALIAIGFTMVFGVGGVLNLAHGALIMAGAYTYLSLVSDSILASVTLHPIVAFPLTIVVVGLISYGLYVVLVRTIEENVVITFLATIVVAIAFTELVTLVFHAQPYQYSVVPGVLQVQALGTRILYVELAAFVVSWVAMGLLWYYVTKTDSGRSIRATSMSERGAMLTGVDVSGVRARTWLVAGGLAGIAGVFLGGIGAAEPTMWLEPLALAFIIVVVGGIGSIKGSVAAAYIVGYLQTATGQFLGQSVRGIMSLVVLVVVLLVLPQGLYGTEFVHE